MSMLSPEPDSNNIGEYVLRTAGAQGRVLHLVHRGQLGSTRPVAGCGIDRADWAELADEDTRCLRLCKTCAQHANDRGVSGADLIAGGL